MSYLITKFKISFKDIDDLKKNSIYKLKKNYYLENKNLVLEKLKTCKISKLKIAFIVAFTIVYLLLGYFVFGKNINYTSEITTSLGVFTLLLVFAVLISYFICYFNENIRKSHCLRILAFAIILYFLIIFIIVINTPLVNFD